MNDITDKQITAVILAGGQGRRLGGQDKGLVAYGNTTLIETVISRIREQTPNIMINANRNLDAYAELGYPLVEDSLEGFQGPLAGFYSAMNQVTTDYILTLPCDGPYVAQDYLQRMLDTLNDKHAELVIATDGERMQPVYALLGVELLGSLQAYLQEGERKIDKWYQRHNYALASFDDDEHMFVNINTQEDIDRHVVG